MVFKNFECDVCLQSFKTNQHLTQHKNRKNKCKPCGQPPPVYQNIVNPAEIPFKNTDLSFSGLLELIFTYKNVLDKNKILEVEHGNMEQKMNMLKYENALLKKKMKTVHQFIKSFHDSTFDNVSFLESGEEDMLSIISA